MIASCPSCETKFNVPDHAYVPGRKARCSNCGHVFALPELTDPFSASSPSSPPPAPARTEPVRAESAPLSGNIPDTPASGEPREETSFQEPDDVVLAPAGGKAPASGRWKNKSRVLILAGIFCVLVLLGYGGYKVFSSFSKPAPTPDANAGKEAAQQELVKHLALENVRQYVVANNEKAGRMVVVEGEVVNNFSVPKELILLEVTLYDDKGKPVAARQQYCGIVLSLFQLQILSKQELEDALKNQVEILTNNTNIQPKKKVPFITVFFNPPDTTYEFGVKIVDVKDPAPKK